MIFLRPSVQIEEDNLNLFHGRYTSYRYLIMPELDKVNFDLLTVTLDVGIHKTPSLTGLSFSS